MNKKDRMDGYKLIMDNADCSFIRISDLDCIGFFDAPASTRFHGEYAGGLFDHSLAVTEHLSELTVKLGLTWQRPESPVIVGLYHDLCKCDLYKFDPETGRYIYKDETLLPEHGAKSIIIAQRYITLTDEEIACIRWHMGAYETETKMWEYYGRAIKKYPNVLYTHMADMIASKIEGV